MLGGTAVVVRDGNGDERLLTGLHDGNSAQPHVFYSLSMMIIEGDAMVWLLNGLHMLCRANRPKFAAHRMHRLAHSERM